MAGTFTRKRWRRPQRMTLEGDVPVRRKDLVVPEPMPLDPADVRRQVRRREATLVAAFLLAAAAEGAVVALPAGLWWPPPVAVALALLYVIVARRRGDGWMLKSLHARPASDPRMERLASALGEQARVGVALHTVDGDAPNALAGGLSGGWVVVSAGTAKLGLLEREALLGREIARLRSHDARLVSLLTVLGGAVELGLRTGGGALLALPVWPACLVIRALTRFFVPSGFAERADVAGALLVRYPPGMRGALEAACVDQPDSLLRATDAFWAAPRVPGSRDQLRLRAELVSEM